MARKRMRRWCPTRVEVLISNVSAAPATSGAAPAAAAKVILKGPFCNNIGYVAKNMPQNSNTMSSYIQAGREEDDDMAFRLLRPQWLTCGFMVCKTMYGYKYISKFIFNLVLLLFNVMLRQLSSPAICVITK